MGKFGCLHLSIKLIEQVVDNVATMRISWYIFIVYSAVLPSRYLVLGWIWEIFHRTRLLIEQLFQIKYVNHYSYLSSPNNILFHIFHPTNSFVIFKLYSPLPSITPLSINYYDHSLSITILEELLTNFSLTAPVSIRILSCVKRSLFRFPGEASPERNIKSCQWTHTFNGVKWLLMQRVLQYSSEIDLNRVNSPGRNKGSL